MRDRFLGQLDTLNQELVAMGDICEEAIKKASIALKTGNAAMAREVLTLEGVIDAKELDIESLCNRLLLLQQPVAGDLRVIRATSKILTNLARIGAQAVDICENLVRKEYNQRPVEMDYFAPMADAVEAMVHNVILAYATRDVALARQVVADDDTVDEYFYKTKNNLTEIIRESISKEEADYALDLLMVDKYYERMGDHAVKIAATVEYLVTDRMGKIK